MIILGAETAEVEQLPDRKERNNNTLSKRCQNNDYWIHHHGIIAFSKK